MQDEGKPQQPRSLQSSPQFWGLPVRRIRATVLQLSLVLAATFAGQWLVKTTGIHSFLFEFSATLAVAVLGLFGIFAVIWLVQAFKKR